MARRALAAIGCAAAIATVGGVKVGDTLPDVSLDEGFPPEKVSLKQFCPEKTFVIMGLPGAFTPT
jgi:peroxiredoxin